MWGNAVTWLLHFSNDVFITGINLLLHTTLLIGICLACRSVMKRNGRKAATQSVVLRACLVTVLISPLTLSFVAFTDLNSFYLSTKLLNPPEKVFEITRKSVNPQSSAQTSGTQKTKIKSIPETLSLKRHTPDTVKKSESSVKDTESITITLPSDIQGNKHSGLTSPMTMIQNTEVNPIQKEASTHRDTIITILAVVFTCFWCIVSLFLLVRFIAINLYIRRLLQLATDAKPEYRETCSKAAEEFGIKSPVILQSRYVHSTMITGFFKPSILLPCGANEVPMASREVFLHELAHLARRDYLWNQLGQVAKIILPFQPLIWVLAHLIEEMSDYVCDDYVVKFSRVNRPYATQLFNLALRTQPDYPQIRAGAGIVSTGSPLRRRIERILDNSYARHVKINANEAMSITLLFVCSITFTGFIGVDRYSPIPTSKYVTQQIDDEIQTHTVNSYTLRHYPETAFASEHAESRIAKPDLDREHEQTLLKKSAHSENDQITDTFIGDGEKQKIKASPVTHEPDTEIIPAKSQENTPRTAEMDTATESAELTAEAMPKSGNNSISEDLTDIQTVDPEAVTMILQDQDLMSLSTITSQSYLDQMSVSTINSGEFDGLALRTLDIDITYDFDNADLTDPEEKFDYDMYRSLMTNKLYPVWSPDGSQIVITDRHYGIWMVSVGGGEPDLIYKNKPVRYNDISIPLKGIEPLCFAPGGHILTYKRYIIDEEMGTEVIIDDSSSPPRVTIMNPIPVIESLDIESGRAQIIAKGAAYGRWSSDGRLFMYSRLDSDSFKELMIRDVFSGQEYPIDEFEALNMQMSLNDRYFMFSEDDIYMIPGTGGLRRFSLSGDITFSDISRDGRWILYTYHSSLHVYDTHNEEETELFPGEYIEPSWARFSPDLTDICFSLKNRDGDWNIYLYDFSNVTGIDDTENDTIPQAFELKENYPNPFNATTTLQFSLPERTHASMAIYNMMGQRIRELVSGEMEPGMHTIVWDSRDDTGRTVGTGTYVAHLEAGNHRAVNKMTLVK